MADPQLSQLDRLRRSMEMLESQRAELGDEAVEPALFALQQQIVTLEEAQLADEDRPEDRRIVTILFTDIVGSSAIASQLDPEDWRAVVAKLHEMAGKTVQEFGGTVVQYLGDGLLALFGVDRSSERDPESAVCAGLEIQKQIPSLETNLTFQLRIGINTGLVVMGDLGSDARREFTASGDAMNVAARLQDASPVGGVLISQSTFRHVRGLFDMAPQAPLPIKGHTAPLQTYQVIRFKPRPYRIASRGVGGVQTSTIGREAERRQVQASFLRALRGERLFWTQLVGRPGVGKSRLLSDFSEMLEYQPEEVTLLRAYALDGDSKEPYALIRRMWYDHFMIPEDASLDEAQRLWTDGITSYLGPDSEEAAHALGLLLGLPFQDSPHHGVIYDDPRQLKMRSFAVSRSLLEKVLLSKALVILIEDLHWTDSSSWDYLSGVVLDSSNRAHGTFIFGTARPEWEPPGTLLTYPTYIQVDLQPLTEAASYMLATELLQRVDLIPEAVVSMIAERSEGVPYFAEEIVNWLIDQRILDQSVDPWQFAQAEFERSPLPSTLQHLQQSRLSVLTDQQREALQYGSIFGRNFWEGGIRALGIGPDPELLSGLEVRGLVEAQPTTSLEGEREWRFHHNLMRDSVYESVLKRQRPDLHRAAGDWLERQARRTGKVDELAGRIGEHAELGGDDALAADWYLRAGRRVMSRGALIEAKGFFDRVLELSPSEDRQRRWKTLLDRDEVLAAIGDTDNRVQGLAIILQLAQELDEPTYLAEAYYRQTVLNEHIGDDQKALQVSQPGLDAAKSAGDLNIEIRLLSFQLLCQTRLGDMEKASTLATEILSLSKELQDEQALSRAYSNLGVYYSETGDLGKAIELSERQIGILHQIGDRIAEAVGLSNVGYFYIQLGQFQRGLESLERSYTINDSLGAWRSRAYNLINLGLCNWRSGDPGSAQQMVERGVEEFEGIDDAFGRGISRSYLALIHETKGDIESAAQYFQEARETLSEMGIRGYEHDAIAGLARCALKAGLQDDAKEHTNKLWKYLRQSDAKGMEFPTWAYLTCTDVFESVGETKKSKAANEAGFQDLMARAERISDETWRKSFLEKLPEHRRLIEIWNRLT